jgi:hypothetical protein
MFALWCKVVSGSRGELNCAALGQTRAVCGDKGDSGDVFVVETGVAESSRTVGMVGKK